MPSQLDGLGGAEPPAFVSTHTAQDEGARAVLRTPSRSDLDAGPAQQTSAGAEPSNALSGLCALGIGCWRIDPTERSIHGTRELFRLLGVEPSGPMALEALLALTHPEDASIAARALTETGEGTPWSLELRVGKRHLLMRGRSEPTGSSGICLDITSRALREEAQARRIAELERHLTERNRALEDAGQELAAEVERRGRIRETLAQSQKLEAIGQLTSGVAHDFNNALNVMNLSFELVKQFATNEQVRTVAGNGLRAAAQAGHLVQGLLGFARSQSTSPRVIDLAEHLETIDVLIRQTLRGRVEYRCEVASDTWPVLVEAHRLEAALINLAANARDATPEGGTVSLSAAPLSPEEARARGLGAGDFTVLCVSDTGCGMQPEVAARATDPFFTTKGLDQGTGLGLAMVQAFADEAGGALRIESAPDAGTRIELLLPRAGMRPAAQPEEVESESRLDDHKGGILLLVDDDEMVRLVLAKTLRSLGYEVIEAANAEMALALAHAMPRLDLIISDLILPGMGGHKLVERLTQERTGLRSLLITGSPEMADLTDDPQLLRKPFSIKQLGDAVLSRLGQPGEPVKRDQEMSDRILVRLRSPLLRDAYVVWLETRGDSDLPSPEALRRTLGPYRNRAFEAAVERQGEEIRLSFAAIGARLSEELGQSLAGELIGPSGDGLLGTLEGAYLRVARSGTPSYEYARFSFDDGKPRLFERLTFPASADGRRITHLFGVVIIVDVDQESTTESP